MEKYRILLNSQRIENAAILIYERATDKFRQGLYERTSDTIRQGSAPWPWEELSANDKLIWRQMAVGAVMEFLSNDLAVVSVESLGNTEGEGTNVE